MKIHAAVPLAILCVVFQACKQKSDAPSSATTNSLKSFLLSWPQINDSDRTYSGNGNAWRFRADGTFTVGALTGLESWGGSGQWRELADGSISIEGFTSNKLEPYSSKPPLKAVITGCTILSTSGVSVVVEFQTKEGLPNKRVEPTADDAVGSASRSTPRAGGGSP